MLRGVEKSRINYKLLTSNSWNLRFIKSSRKKCFPITRMCRLAGFFNNKTFSQAFLLSFLAAKNVYDLHFTTILAAWKVMKAGLSVFRSACVTTMDTTLGFIRDNVVLSTFFLPIVTSLCH
jgi:hypothetical protein